MHYFYLSGAVATFGNLAGVSISQDNSFAVVTDLANHLVRIIRGLPGTTAASVTVSTLAGSGSAGSNNGVGIAASFNLPIGIVISPNMEYALVGDRYNHQIRKVIISTGNVYTLAGSTASGMVDGVGADARFNGPVGVCHHPVDAGLVLTTEESGNRIASLSLYLPTGQPSTQPTSMPSLPTGQPTSAPSIPTGQPSGYPTDAPRGQPTSQPSTLGSACTN